MCIWKLEVNLGVFLDWSPFYLLRQNLSSELISALSGRHERGEAAFLSVL